MDKVTEFSPIIRDCSFCPCCRDKEIFFLPAYVSAFLARRAFNSKPQPTKLACCRTCGYAFFERGLSDSDASRLYTNYRDEHYLMQRRKYEPFYNRSAHTAVESWESNPDRGNALKNIFTGLKIHNIGDVLDYGGNSGSLAAALGALRTCVYDISGVTPLAGVESLRHEPEPESWDVVISAAVLEHVNDPVETVRYLFSLVKPGGFLYLEVPDELKWKDKSGPHKIKKLCIALACKFILFSILLDCYTTYFRLTQSVIPPLGVLPMREHINYFTLESLKKLISRLDKSFVMLCDVSKAGIFCVIQKKL